MTISQFVYEKLTGSTNITGIVGNYVTPDVGEYDNIPIVVYKILSEERNKILHKNVMSIKCAQTTQDLCLTLNTYIYDLFDDSTSNLAEQSSSIKIESINIINNIPAQYDPVNKNWFGVTDINFNYIN